ncbi:acyl-CoA N-acyltransferase [Auriculariales sp. MPI-PUGE-AT-0066]|nr:acyl-CoA N-acyltransferase [Auriculariales sp. MPI-PUGE-AT-0066]
MPFLKDLQNDRVKLVQFEAGKHIPLLLHEHRVYPELWRHYPTPTAVLENEKTLTEWYETVVEKEPTKFLWAVFDVASDDFAGIIGLLNTSQENMTTEIGYVTVAQRWHRTHINTNMTGLLLRFCFDELKMRRVQWQAFSSNTPSINAAKRLGFELEGIQRWQRVLPIEREGVTRPGEPNPGVHSAILAICWDNWEAEGFQAELQAKMDRKA